jgi:hypothetical protein
MSQLLRQILPKEKNKTNVCEAMKTRELLPLSIEMEISINLWLASQYLISNCITKLNSMVCHKNK